MAARKLKIGIVGGGAIGSALAEFCSKELAGAVELAGVYDLDKTRSNFGSLKDLINSSDLVVEAASAKAAPGVMREAVKAGKDIMIMSTGGIVNETGLLESAGKAGCKVYFPSGAICGLDGVKAVSLNRVRSVTLTTKKPPKGLEGAPYLKEKGIDLSSLKGDKVVFEGTALEAVKAFPKNINVSAALSLAGIGAERTRVRIVCSPGAKANIHEIEVDGESAKLFMRTENIPSPGNPKTSYLAVSSAMAAIKGIIDSVRVGT